MSKKEVVKVCCGCHRVFVMGDWIVSEYEYEKAMKEETASHGYCPGCVKAMDSILEEMKESRNAE